MEYSNLDTKTLCLAVLSLADASGYEIKKRVEDTFARFMEVAPSGIYAALKVLDQEGLVSARHIPQEGKPNKTVYTLLPEGRQRLLVALSGLEGRHRIRSELVALLMFAEMLPPQKIRDVMTVRLKELEQTEVEMQAVEVVAPGQRFLIGMGSAIVGAELAYLRANLPGLLAELDDAGDRT